LNDRYLIPLYPFLFLLYVILIPLFNNLGQVNPIQALRPLGVLSAIAFLGLLLLYLTFRDWRYAAYLVFLFLVFFFGYGHLRRILQGWLSWQGDAAPLALLTLWGGLIVILGLRNLWRRSKAAQWVPGLLNISLSVALLMQAIPGVINLLQGGGSAPQRVTQAAWEPDSQPLSLDCSQQPDIYYLILDGYGRADVLEQQYGADNHSFLDYLERKGFFVAQETHSNYTQTVFSIPSALNFTYLDSEPQGVSGLDYFSQLIAKNRLELSLEGCGYQSIAFETGFYFTNLRSADIYLSNGAKLNEFESLLLADTPLDLLMDNLNLGQGSPGYSYAAHRERVLYDFEKLKQIPRMPGPKFVFAHILSPHPPFVFQADGTPTQPARGYSMGDGDDFGGDWEEYRQGYAGQVEFVDRQMEGTLDAILARSSTPPIIIIQGDHGPGGFLNWSSPEQSCLWERTSILNAYYLPGGAEDHLYPGISPVNTFRVVLNAYFGTHLELLPDRTYFTSHRLPRQIIDITTERDSKANCGE
jgi:hypothetical protein